MRTMASIHKQSRRIAPVIHLRNVRLRRGPEPLLDSATASILRGEKVGIVGRNGSGKSSLLALIKGELTPDQGNLEIPPTPRDRAIVGIGDGGVLNVE